MSCFPGCGRCTYNQAISKDIRREANTGCSMRLRATPHWIAQSAPTKMHTRRYHRAHLKVTNLGASYLNGATRRLIVDKNVVRFDI